MNWYCVSFDGVVRCVVPAGDDDDDAGLGRGGYEIHFGLLG